MFSAWARTTFVALGSRDFRRLFIGTLCMQIGFGMLQVVQGIVAFDLTGKNSAVGLVALGAGSTQLTLGPIGGTLTDRLPKRTLLMLGQAVVGGIFAVTGVLILTDTISILVLVALGVILGAMFAVIGPTRQAWVGDLLAGEERANAVALAQMGVSVSRIIGPFLAGGMVAIAAVGPGGTYLGMALLFAVGILVTAGMPAGRPSAPQARSVLGEVALGMGYVASRPGLRLLVATSMLVTVTAFSYQVLLPGFFENALGRPASELGLAYGVVSVGAITVTVYIAGRSTLAAGRAVHVMGVLGGLSVAGVALAPNLGVCLAALLAVGVFTSGFQTLNNVAILEASDATYYGRVIAIVLMSFGLQGVAAYPLGIAADAVGERQALFACGVGAMVVVLVSAAASRVTPAAPAAATAEP